VTLSVQTLGVRRLPEIDNLKTVMVAWIIAGHALLGYAAIGGWPYDEVNEVTLGRRSELALAAVLGPSALFVVGTFFFLAGLFAAPAVDRKGPARFARERMLRLGVPFLAFALLIWPLSMWLAYRAAGHDVSYWWAFTHRQPLLDSGPLWFAEVLLLFSLAYAAWAGGLARWGRQPDSAPTPLGARQLVALGAGLTIASFIVRLWFPARSTQILDLHLWQWPPCLAMFALGITTSRRGWLTRVPPRLYDGCGLVVVATLVATPVLGIGLGVSDLAGDATAFVGGGHWQALVLAGLEAFLLISGSIWLLGLAQRRMARGGHLSAACGRSAYAAFILQAPVLLALATAMRPLAAPPEAKALVVGALAVPACLGLGWLGITRTRLGRLV
jgi:hypothetical protein